MSPCGQSFKDMHPCVSDSPPSNAPWVVQHCKWIELWALMCGRISQNARFVGGVHWAPHYVGRGDSRDGGSFFFFLFFRREQHPFWLWFIEFSWQISFCFRSVCFFSPLLSLPFCIVPLQWMKPPCWILMYRSTRLVPQRYKSACYNWFVRQFQGRYMFNK